MDQFKWCLYVTCGPPGLMNGALAALTLPRFIDTPVDATAFFPKTVVASLVQFVLLQLIGDFFLYWGHRVQHDVPYLWKHFHSFHHSIGTPTPFSTICIVRTAFLADCTSSRPLRCIALERCISPTM